ncbi:tRNA pseudouridine(13) synthase TruD [Nitratifractor sp.]
MTYPEKTYAYDHRPLSFRFFQSTDRFIVEEIPLRPATGRGDWLLLKILKRDLSTWRLLNILKAATGASDREIGYAGLKDKAATAIQYLTLPARYERGLKNLATERIELLESRRTRGPIRPGELRGNRFKIFVDRIDPKEKKRLMEVAESIGRGGFANYFGYQRFGEEGRAWEQGREIAHSGKRLKGAKERLLAAAWQSHLFNGWLSRRLKAGKIVDSHSKEEAARILEWPVDLCGALQRQPQPFKLLHGDLLRSYTGGRLLNGKNPEGDAESFRRRRLVPTGLLPGAKVWRARGDARYLEEPWDDPELGSLPGERRDAWVWPEALGSETDPSRPDALWLEFTLPPGAYATTLLEEISHTPLAPQKKRRR